VSAGIFLTYLLIYLLTNVNMVWRQRICVTNYVDQQTLKPDDD